MCTQILSSDRPSSMPLVPVMAMMVKVIIASTIALLLLPMAMRRTTTTSNTSAISFPQQDSRWVLFAIPMKQKPLASKEQPAKKSKTAGCCFGAATGEISAKGQQRNNNNNNNNGNNGNANSQYNYQQQQQDKSDLYQFLECTEYVNEYGQAYFVGPHCGSDHYTISLGVFSDENCVNYLGETVSLSKVLGYGYDDESFFHLPHECISCDGAQQFEEDEERYEEMYHGQGIYGDYVEAPNAEFDDVVAMCAALFERSAQCNIHMTNYGMMAKYMETIDVEYEKRYCNFIDNIVYGTYNEGGDIKLKADTFDFNDWKNPEQYKKMQMPAGQAVGLALSILLVIALAALAFVTQRSLTRGGSPWQPRRFFNKQKDIERQQSGIVMGRSQSGIPNNPPLI
mmetsp:Transcript_26025/g.54501  ORF Transcript_26025/g.54501 Transcript_26025/m.54501 type:complete len:397 (-) Transcript_26025:150-1340(-)